ncbi:S8 family serine peptidase [Streptomyces cheonanensis]|uniref:S8 family serine peptidase n=1 Tax=Streptomyces cheonanensis TaxID=312720 RepID=A0ABP5H524_9ACTN|nr:S8 family peptidase [Streptomyces sp. AA0539]
MKARKTRSIAAVLATATVLALFAGPTGAAALPTAPPGTGAGATLTLITGDRVLLDGTGAVSAVQRGEGREHIPIRVAEHEGTTLVVPWDAEALIAEGTLDAALFDVRELTREAYRSFDGTPLIVSYEDGSRAVTDTLRADDGIEVRARLNAASADALTVEDESTATLWETVTHSGPAPEDTLSPTAAPGIKAVSLDRVREPSLEHSTGQIGADTAWEAGYDGSGVTIAVLDTGIAADHGDFGDRIRGNADFTDEGTADTEGHGTHVASIAAGSGDRSDGTYRGVAPGADLLIGKVLGERGGLDSWIIAGMEWAVDEGADIVNMSLGAAAWPGHDPLVEAVDQLSEAHEDVLFVIAAGNDGPDEETVGSPGIAAGALTVGAVDRDDTVGDFSSAGPVPLRDGALKPDLSAPGVEIVAAAAPGSAAELTGTPVTDGYLGLSGTSMATPHVAGAAALLRQRNPELTGAELKSTLVGSATAIDAAPARTGTGRLDLVRALDQTLTAGSAALDFGTVPFPYGGADRITREITYRNSGDQELTLGLELSGGAPEKLFSLGADTVTVPAGGTATVEVTADPATLPASAAGHYGLVVTGTAGDQQIRTAGSLTLEPELVDITVEITGHDGRPAEGARLFVVGEEDGFNVLSEDGIATGRVQAGDYLIEVLAPSPWDAGPDDTRTDWALAPVMTLDATTTLQVDLRETEPLDFTAPDPAAVPNELAAAYTTPDSGFWMWYFGAPPDGVSSLAIPGAGHDGLTLSLASFHTGQDGEQYHGYRELTDTFPTGLDNHPAPADVAQVTAVAGTRLPGSSGYVGAVSPGFGLGLGADTELPGTVELYLQSGAPWGITASQYDADGMLVQTSRDPQREFAPGREHTVTLNSGVFGPAHPIGAAFVRDGNLLWGELSFFTPGSAEDGWAEALQGRTRVYRDGELVRDLAEHIGYLAFGLPAGESEYRIVSTASRADLGYTDVSTEVTVDHTFRSDTTAGPEPVTGPLAVRYAPELAADNTAPGGAAGFPVPLSVQGGTAVSLAVEVSVDGGESWHTVHDGAGDIGVVAVDNPPAGGSVSLRATAVGPDGHRTVQTIIDAYRTR